MNVEQLAQRVDAARVAHRYELEASPMRRKILRQMQQPADTSPRD